MQIPYFALRHHTKLREDGRTNAKEKMLKQSTDLRFLNLFQEATRGPEKLPYLYEAQISIAIMEIDNWKWSA